MKIGTNGLITDQFGKVLVMLRDDTRTWTLPGGVLAPGELPDEGVARAVEEETGLKVMPGRLVGLYYRATSQDEHLVFTFRCLVRGGQIVSSDESSQIGYAGPAELPRPMLGIHRERIERAIAHSGGPPYWGVQEESGVERLVGGVVAPLVYAWQDLQRRRRGEPAYEPPPSWTAAAFVLIRDLDGGVLWIRPPDDNVWMLPGGAQEPGEPPWATAARATRELTGLAIDLTDLSGAYVQVGGDELVLTFTAEVASGEPGLAPEAAALAYFQPGDEPADAPAAQVEWVADAARPWDTTFFRRQERPAREEEAESGET